MRLRLTKEIIASMKSPIFLSIVLMLFVAGEPVRHKTLLPQIKVIPLDTSADKVTADAFGLPQRNKRTSQFGVLRATAANGQVRTVEVDLSGVPQAGVQFVIEEGELVAKWKANNLPKVKTLASASELSEQGIVGDETFRIHYGLDFQSRNMAGDPPEAMEFVAGIPGKVKLIPNSTTNTIGVIPSENPKIVVQYLHASVISVVDDQPVLPRTPLGKTGNITKRDSSGKPVGSGVIHLHVQVRDIETGRLLDPDLALAPLLQR